MMNLNPKKWWRWTPTTLRRTKKLTTMTKHNFHTLPKALRSAVETLAWVRHQWRRPQENDWERQCWHFCREAWGLPPVYPTAHVGYDNAVNKHKFTSIEKVPYGGVIITRPKGSDSGPWHSVIRGGRDQNKKIIVWSVDIRALGDVSPVYLDDLLRKWNHEVVGWIGDVNGYLLPIGENK